MKKIAIFGDCILKGSNSYFYFEDGNIKSGSRTTKDFLNNREKVVFVDELKKHYEVKNYCKAYSGLSHSACRKPWWAEDIMTCNSVVDIILNNDLSEFDTIIIFACVNDYRISPTLGEKSDITPITPYGALNMIFKELKDKYSDKEVIFILPPFIKDRSDYKSFEEYLQILKDFIIENDFEYISFYDHIKTFVKKPWHWKLLFPDGRHPSLDCGHYMCKWLKDRLEDKFPKE